MNDHDVNRRIAERLGWHDFEMDTYWEETYGDVSEIECWFGCPPNDNYRQPVPNYSSDLRSAMRLFNGEYAYRIEMAIVEQLPVVTYGLKRVQAKGYEPWKIAAAMCEAWLAWMDELDRRKAK